MSRIHLRSSNLLLGAVVLTAGVMPALAAGVPKTAVPAKAPVLAAMRGYQIVATNCFKCHGDATKLSKLDLRTRDLALKGGAHGPALVGGKASASALYRHITGQLKPQMPPTGGLPDADVAAIKAWIDAGAPYPANASATDGKWWAFRPISKPAVPALHDPWIRTPVDAFILAKLKDAGLRPSPLTDRVTLIRRATFDLHGLPPTPEEIDAFVNDRSPNAWEKVVDRLLASPRYGERCGRVWLDLSRFAESEGFKADETRPDAWRYRDYVINSFNADKPYDRFIREQIAGDEIYPHNPEALVATGFNRHWADESNARNLALRRQEILNDITDTVGSTILGVTLGCARCHDHKYDPISQKDYYRIQAFFAAVQPRSDLPLATADQMAEYRQRMTQWEAQTRELRQRLAVLEEPVRAKLVHDKRMPFPDDVQDAIDTPAAKRTALQWQLYEKVLPQITVADADVGKAMKGEAQAEWKRLTAEIQAFAPAKPAPLPVCLGITDVGREAPKTYTLAVGVYDNPIAEVQPGFLSAVDAKPPVITRPADLPSTGRRTALANWLASPANPLTARVMVNRVWQSHFGRGIVGTASDFGKAGEPPTHPELLDYLAAYLTGHRWSLKRLHRLILTSSAYQQSSSVNPKAVAKDPDDSLLWRYRRWRLEAEMVRDACLSVCGQLNEEMGGPSVFPELPAGVSTRGGWTLTADEKERNRRSVYIFVRRNMRYPLFEAFDFPDTHEPCARRAVTNTAPQALMLFNSELSVHWAQAMAGRIIREASTSEGRVERAYRLAFGRAPESAERDLSMRFLKRQSEIVKGRVARGEKVALPIGVDASDAPEGAAWVDFCHALVNTNEFLYVD